MGTVVTTNSATLVNKGLEVIEAHLLFDVPFDRIEVVVHPQSIVHSMVEFVDGSTIAQASPARHAPADLARARLAAPGSGCRGADRLDASRSPGPSNRSTTPRFPRSPSRSGWGRPAARYPAVFNAANEQAVEAFHARRVGFLGILETVERVVDAHEPRDFVTDGDLTLDGLLAAERWARDEADRLLAAAPNA